MHSGDEPAGGHKSVDEQVREKEAKRINDMIVKKAQEKAQKEKDALSRRGSRRFSVARRFSVGRRNSNASGLLPPGEELAAAAPRRGSQLGIAGWFGGGSTRASTGGTRRRSVLGGMFGSSNSKKVQLPDAKTELFEGGDGGAPSGAADDDGVVKMDTADAPAAKPAAAAPASGQAKASGQSYQSGGGRTSMPTLIGSAPVQAVRTSIIEAIAKGGPVSVDRKKAMQGLYARAQRERRTRPPPAPRTFLCVHVHMHIPACMHAAFSLAPPRSSALTRRACRTPRRTCVCRPDPPFRPCPCRRRACACAWPVRHAGSTGGRRRAARMRMWRTSPSPRSTDARAWPATSPTGAAVHSQSIRWAPEEAAHDITPTPLVCAVAPELARWRTAKTGGRGGGERSQEEDEM